MKKGIKALLMAAGLLLTGAAAGAVTLAYFTDSATKTNTFTMGDVDIDIDEPGWNPNTPDDPDDPTNPGKDLTPGSTKVKDPTVTSSAGKSYMRIKMELQDMDGNLLTDAGRISRILSTLYYDKGYDISKTPSTPNLDPANQYSAAQLEALVSGGSLLKEYNTTDFTYDTSRSSDAGIRYYNYTANQSVFEENASAVLFSSVVIPSDWNKTEIGELKGSGAQNGYKIVLTAQAIQYENMPGAQEAYDALDNP